MVRVILAIIGLSYLATSAVVAINGFVWLPTFPSVWYRMQNILYWPFQPYFDLMLSLLGNTDIPYEIYAVLTRIPFVAMGLVIVTVAARSPKRRTRR